jgi:hypothetical protein
MGSSQLGLPGNDFLLLISLAYALLLYGKLGACHLAENRFCMQNCVESNENLGNVH